jgi:hypothetical protein
LRDIMKVMTKNKIKAELEQVGVVLLVAALICILFQFYTSLALKTIAAVLSFFIGILVYEQFIRGERGAVSTRGERKVSRVAKVYIFFLLAILISTIISDFTPNFILNIWSGTFNLAQEFGLGLFFSLIVFLGMRIIYYKGRILNAAAVALITITIMYFAAFILGVL